MYENTYPDKRYQKTLEFLNQHVTAPSQVLDLGVKNPFSEIMLKEGYKVTNTGGEDLDEKFDIVKQDFEVVTAFEIFEHFYSGFEKAPGLNLFGACHLFGPSGELEGLTDTTLAYGNIK